MSDNIILKNVRLSYPSLFSKAEFNGQKGKYEATFLIPKTDTATKAALDAMIAEALSEARVQKVPADKYCLKDGDDSDQEGYAGHWSFKASSKKRPTVINLDKSSLVEEDNVLYPGCYVNGMVDIWIQNNTYGKRVNANLYGVQFVKDGEAFGNGPIDVTDMFEDISEAI
tara:strand:- start:482 stop:991 length:510 start_codon:yes stop_codon:yes gene_type:complete